MNLWESVIVVDENLKVRNYNTLSKLIKCYVLKKREEKEKFKWVCAVKTKSSERLMNGLSGLKRWTGLV